MNKKTNIFIFLLICLCSINSYALNAEIIENESYDEKSGGYNICYNRSLMTASVGEWIEYQEFFRHRLDILKNQSSRTSIHPIPKISHHIWLTSAENPKNVDQQCIEYIKNTLKLVSKDAGWRNIFWTNNRNLIKETIENLDEFGIEVKEINEANLKSFNDIKAIYEKSFEYNLAMPSDIASYVILHEYGGVYFDIDYELKQSMDHLMEKYSFIAHEEPMKNLYIGNAFIAASVNHPIISESLGLLYRNFSKQAPEYISRACHDRAFTISAVGPIVMTLAFYHKANWSDEYNDIFVTDNVSLYEDVEVILHDKLGVHYGANTWKKENEQDIYPYCKTCLKFMH
jgi:mannosyltransferase OCH1-like enzyme